MVLGNTKEYVDFFKCLLFINNFLYIKHMLYVLKNALKIIINVV